MSCYLLDPLAFLAEDPQALAPLSMPRRQTSSSVGSSIGSSTPSIDCPTDERTQVSEHDQIAEEHVPISSANQSFSPNGFDGLINPIGTLKLPVAGDATHLADEKEDLQDSSYMMQALNTDPSLKKEWIVSPIKGMTKLPAIKSEPSSTLGFDSPSSAYLLPATVPVLNMSAWLTDNDWRAPTTSADTAFSPLPVSALGLSHPAFPGAYNSTLAPWRPFVDTRVQRPNDEDELAAQSAVSSSAVSSPSLSSSSSNSLRKPMYVREHLSLENVDTPKTQAQRGSRMPLSQIDTNCGSIYSPFESPLPNKYHQNPASTMSPWGLNPATITPTMLTSPVSNDQTPFTNLAQQFERFAHAQTPQQRPAFTEKRNGHMSVLGIPPQGIRNRIETSIRLRLLLSESLVQQYRQVRVSENLIPHHFLLKHALKNRKPKPLSQDALSRGTLLLVADVFKSDALINLPHTTSSQEGVTRWIPSSVQPIQSVCRSCMIREYKRSTRRRSPSFSKSSASSNEILSPVEPSSHHAQSFREVGADKLLLMLCEPLFMIDAMCPSFELPTRITCYCRHYQETIGYIVRFTLIDEQTGAIVASQITPPVMISDDYKTTPANMRTKRNHDSVEAVSETGTSNFDIAPGPPLVSQGVPAAMASYMTHTIPQQPQRPAIANMPHRRSLSTDHARPLQMMPVVNKTPPKAVSSDTIPQQLVTKMPESFLRLEKVVPASGPITGGIEVTLLGNFPAVDIHSQILFGTARASILTILGHNTIVCLLPSAIAPGLVTIRVGQQVSHDVSQSQSSNEQTFLYVDETERSLMELALQIIGKKMTGRAVDAKCIALAIINSTGAPSPSQTDVNVDTPTNQKSYQGNPEPSTSDLQYHIVQSLKGLGRNAQRVLYTKSLSGHNLLHLSCSLGYEQIVLALAKMGMDLNLADKNGLTPLQLAIMHGHVEVVRCLLRYNVRSKMPEEVSKRLLRFSTQEQAQRLESLLQKSSILGNKFLDEDNLEDDGYGEVTSHDAAAASWTSSQLRTKANSDWTHTSREESCKDADLSGTQTPAVVEEVSDTALISNLPPPYEPGSSMIDVAQVCAKECNTNTRASERRQQLKLRTERNKGDRMVMLFWGPILVLLMTVALIRYVPRMLNDPLEFQIL